MNPHEEEPQFNLLKNRPRMITLPNEEEFQNKYLEAEKQVDELSKELAELKDERTLLSERKKVIKQRLLDTLEGGSDDGAEPGATYNQSRDSREIEEIEGRMEQNMFSTTKKTLLLRELQKALGIPVKVPEQKPSLQ